MENVLLQGKKPDFQGEFEMTGFIPDTSKFHLYILHREKEYIFGVMRDKFGDSVFSGELSDKKFEFKKDYSNQAIKNQAARSSQNFSFKGNAYKGKMKGTWKFADPEEDEEPSKCSIEQYSE